MSDRKLHYAPVMIPTLCRYEHFKACVESLMKCAGADETDVFIGLDYPVKTSQQEGYERISEYLEKLKTTHNFKSLNVIKRERNYGTGGSGNAALLRLEILKEYDRIIFTEDDNIFAPSFLEFINKGLEIFQEDQRVQAICGYRHFYNIKYGQNNYFRQSVDFSAWGYGTWKNRIERIHELNPSWFRKRLTLKNFLKVKKYSGNYRALQFFQLSFTDPQKFVITDNVISVFMCLEGIDVIMPVVSKVKNAGVDGSGENFKKTSSELIERHNAQKISSDSAFDFYGNPKEFYDYNRMVFKNENYSKLSNAGLIKELVLRFIKYFIKKI